MNNTQELKGLTKINQGSLGCSLSPDCDYKERTISYAVGVNIPDQQDTPEEIFKECCYNHIVLADLESTSDLKNDFSSFFHQKQIVSETASFFLYDFNEDNEIEIVDNTYGLLYDFGSFDTNGNFKGFKLEWKKVLEALGTGAYKVITRISVTGIQYEKESLVFNLNHYSDRLADKTVRIDVIQNGLLRKPNIDFTGLFWKDSVRVKGFFGNREAQFEEDILVTRNFDRTQISMSQTNEYKFQTLLIPDCVTDQIVDFFVMANDIFVSDYNLNNHSYKYKKYPVKYSSNEGTRYGSHTRKAQLNLVFSDKKLDNRKNNFY